MGYDGQPDGGFRLDARKLRADVDRAATQCKPHGDPVAGGSGHLDTSEIALDVDDGLTRPSAGLGAMRTVFSSVVAPMVMKKSASGAPRSRDVPAS